MSTPVSSAPALGECPPARPGLARAVHLVALGATAGGLAGMTVDPHPWYALAVSLGWTVWLVPGLARLAASVHRDPPAQPSRPRTTPDPGSGLRLLGGPALAAASAFAVLLPTLLG